MLSLIFVSQQTFIYIGIPIFVACGIGGLLNIVIFLRLQTFRQNSCAFYLTVMPFFNICQLITGLLNRIMLNGFAIDWMQRSNFYCKFGRFHFEFCSLISLTCMCLATIDQFLATSISPSRHRWNNIKLARVLCTTASVIWLLHSIPHLFYNNHIVSLTTGKVVCTITNLQFQRYHTYVYCPILAGFLPIFIMAIFGFLSYRNVKKMSHRKLPLVRRGLNLQLTMMILVQVVYNIFVLMPKAITAVIERDIPSTDEVNFAQTLIIIIYYSYFASPFYIYVCVSKRFRQQLFHVLFQMRLHHCYQREIGMNAVVPQ